MKKTNMKKYVISLGSVAMVAMPVVAAISCSTTDSPYKPGANGVNLNNVSGTLMHQLFKDAGSIKVGDKLNLTVNSKTYVITWTAENAEAELSASPAELFEIIIEDFLALPDAPARADVVTALGTSASNAGHHGVTISPKAPSKGVDFTGVANNREFWHQYFRTELEGGLGADNIKAGAQITLSLSETETITTTWTAEDVAFENTADANQLVSYVAVKFADEYAETLAHRALDATNPHAPERGATQQQKDAQTAWNTQFEQKVEDSNDEAITEVWEAMGGQSTSSHHDYSKLTTLNADGKIVTANLTPTWSTRGVRSNTTLWHSLFRFENIVAKGTIAGADGKLTDDPKTSINETADNITSATGTIISFAEGKTWDETNKTTETVTNQGTIVDFEWTAADSVYEDKLNQDDLFDYISARLMDKSEDDAYRYAKSSIEVTGTAPSLTYTATAPAAVTVGTDLQSADIARAKAIRRGMKVDSTGHHNVPAGTPEAEEADYAFDFTNMINDRTTWHEAFRYEPDKTYGEQNLGAGSVIRLRVMGNNIYYTWTTADVNTEANLNPEQLQDYVAMKFFQAANGQFTLEQVRTAMGFEFAAASHHEYPEWGYVNGVYDLTPAWNTRLKPSAGFSANTTIWHDMFRLEHLVVGQKIQLNITASTAAETDHDWDSDHHTWKTGGIASFTWTAEDAANEDSLNQDDLFDYIARRFYGATAKAAFDATKAGTPLGTQMQEVGAITADPSHGITARPGEQASEASIRALLGVDVAGHHGVGF